MKTVFWPNDYSVCETIGEMVRTGAWGCLAYFPHEDPIYLAVAQLEADHCWHHHRFCS